MEKLKLVNGKEIAIEYGMTENHFEVIIDDMSKLQELKNDLTKENMTPLQLLNDGGLVCREFESKRLTEDNFFTLSAIGETGNYRVGVNLAQPNTLIEQVAKNTADIDYMKMMEE